MPLQEELEKQGNVLFKYRGIIPLVILAAALILVYFQVTADPYEFAYDPFATNTIAALVVALFGQLIRIYTVGHTPKHTSGRNTKEQVADVLNSTGIYSLVRHPLYVGNYFMWLGVGMLTDNYWFLLVFTLVYYLYYERIMFAEEQFLRRKFGQSYVDWAGKTSAFIPSLTGFKKPSVRFSWAKVIKKEKNGFLAIFVCFFLFQFMVQSIVEEEWTLIYDGWFYACAASIVGYYIIKALRKFTSILEEAPK